MKTNPTLKIDIAGHTDNIGDPAKNQKLSEERVKVIKDYLLKNGIDGSRVTGKGYGGTKPVASNENEETRKMNRRVEFTIVEK
jgi:outer membrane protein OmpA-like peptidoglycan-associated protein